MREIPEDVMRIADGIASDIPTRVTDMHRTFAANVIARAILDERGRAAQVANAVRADIERNPHDGGRLDAGGIRAAEKIEEFIRRGSNG